MVINSLRINKTREKTIGFVNLRHGVWMFCDLEHHKQDDAPVTIGPRYASKAELLADCDRYLKEYGFE